MVSKFAKSAPMYILAKLAHWKLLKSDQQPSTLLQKGYDVMQFTPVGNTPLLLIL